MSKNEHVDAHMAEAQPTKLSPISTKSRSLPTTPSQRPHSPPRRRVSPNTAITTREGSPQSLRTGLSRTPPVFRRGMICKYETGMAQARRRVPYTLGPEKLDPDTEAGSKRLNPKEEFRLTTELNILYEKLVPTQESETRRRDLVQKLESLLQETWPVENIKVSVFGSTGNKLGTSESDVDVCITTECKDIEHVCSIADLLARNGMERVVCVSSAKVPIVKVWDPVLQVACDMNVNNPIALENTELIRSYVAIDHRVRPLAMLVKHWTKRRILNDAALGGTLSSYTWICLVLNFLQTRKPPILPALQQAPGLKPHLVGGINVAFEKDTSKYEDFGKANTSSLGDLLFQFFHYYGHELDFEKSVMSVRLGKVIPKSQKAWHLLQDNRLCVEEPFNVTRNLGNTADDTSVKGIHLELRRACDLVASGNFEKCCEQYTPAQAEPPPRRNGNFIPPTTKAIVPQPPPQPQHNSQRTGRNNFKNNRRAERQNQSVRRASNPASRPTTHLRDLPFAMTPQELQLQQQHQQHLLHDQLFQQYQFLQMQEQELRLQLYRQRGLMAASGYSSGALSGHDSADDSQEPLKASRNNANVRGPLTAPLYQSRFPPTSPFAGTPSPGIVTNPASPLLGTVLPDSRRYTRRASVNNAAANTLRAQSQPARGMPNPTGFPYVTSRFDIPVRRANAMGSRRGSVNSSQVDPLTAYLQGRLSSQGTRYDAGRRPVEYVGYYVGQSPLLSAYQGSTTISPVPSHAGLAINNNGMSPRMSTRNSRLPSMSTSPSLHYVAVANGAHMMSPVTEHGPISGLEPAPSPPPSISGPLIVDGSINSPPRIHLHNRPARGSSDELDRSVTTSDDVAIDTPSSSDEMSSASAQARYLNGTSKGHSNGDVVRETEFISLNDTSARFGQVTESELSAPSGMLDHLEEARTVQQLTDALTAATVNGRMTNGVGTRKGEQIASALTATSPLVATTNGSHSNVSSINIAHEWQTQNKKRRKKKAGKGDLSESALPGTGGDVLPENEAMRKGG